MSTDHHPPTYTELVAELGEPPAPHPASITCPECEMTSHHREDIRNGYCGNCHEFTSQPVRYRP